jgi:hypothetical protein
VFQTNGSTERGRFDTSGNFLFNSGYGSVATAYGCRAWVNFNGTGTVAIRASGNVSSITDNGTGQYTLNFSKSLVDANYSIAAYTTWSDDTAAAMGISGRANDTKTTNSLKVWTVRTSDFLPIDSPQVNVSIFR